MELTKKEQMLIEAIRDIGGPPANFLLWYAEAMESNAKNSASPQFIGYYQEKARKANDWSKKIGGGGA